MWQKQENTLHKKFEFNDFEEALGFVQKVADVARKLDHHPKIVNEFNTVELWLTTHSAGDKVTDKDKDFAQEIDNLFSKKDEKPTQISIAKVFTDGGSRGNPGPSAIGYVISNMDDSVVKKQSEFIGQTTNNQAEYKALLSAMEDCESMGIKSLEIFMDSELIVNQLIGTYKIKNQDLKPFYLKIKNLESQFERVSYTHIPRAQNAIADGLVNEALDEAARS